MAKPSVKRVEQAPFIDNSPQRKYRGSVTLDHDLYKLKLAIMHKNMSFSEVEEYVAVEHVHFFHTIDSSGRKKTTCEAVGGHFHEMIVTHNESGPPTVTCGPSVKEGMQKIRGVMTRIMVPFNNEDDTQHTHEVEYQRSETVKPRAVNAEAVRLETEMAQKTAPIPGVIG